MHAQCIVHAHAHAHFTSLVCDIRDGVGRRTNFEEWTLIEYAVLDGSMKAPAEHASSRRASGVSVDMVVPVRLRPIGVAFVLVGVVDTEYDVVPILYIIMGKVLA